MENELLALIYQYIRKNYEIDDSFIQQSLEIYINYFKVSDTFEVESSYCMTKHKEKYREISFYNYFRDSVVINTLF